MTPRPELVARRAARAPVAEAEVLARRAEAHRVLRVERGAHAALYSRSAASAAIHPAEEFADVEAWRDFLTPLYPAWAIEIGVELYASPNWVVLHADAPPHRRWNGDDVSTDMKFYTESGHVGVDGQWKIDPGEPLGETPPPPKPRSGRPSARERLRAIGDGLPVADPRTATRRKS